MWSFQYVDINFYIYIYLPFEIWPKPSKYFKKLCFTPKFEYMYHLLVYLEGLGTYTTIDTP
jgi:hypothetical protein